MAIHSPPSKNLPPLDLYQFLQWSVSILCPVPRRVVSLYFFPLSFWYFLHFLRVVSFSAEFFSTAPPPLLKLSGAFYLSFKVCFSSTVPPVLWKKGLGDFFHLIPRKTSYVLLIFLSLFSFSFCSFPCIPLACLVLRSSLTV